MDAIQSSSAARLIAAVSSVATANRQPQLALDLILQTTQALQAAGTAQSAPQPVASPAAVPSVSGTAGSIINIFA